MGTVAGHRNVLADALTSGAGAVIGETVAEALADREQLMKEAKTETYAAKGSFDPDYCFALYRQKLQPYVDIGRLAAGAAIAAVGRDPTLAIAAAANALENNFAKSIPLPKIGGIPGVDIVAILQEALAGMDIKQLYEKIGVDGIFWKLVDEGVIQVHQFKPGQFSYTIGDEIFHTPEDAWRTVVRSVPFCTSIEEKEWQKGRTLQDTFGSASFQQKLGGVAKERFDSSSQGKQKVNTKSGMSGGMPNPDWEPEDEKDLEKVRSRSKNYLKPYQETTTEHTSFKVNKDGRIVKYETYKPNSQNPSGFDTVKRVDLEGKSHFNKKTGLEVPTPHVQGKNISGGVRTAHPNEVPKTTVIKETN